MPTHTLFLSAALLLHGALGDGEVAHEPDYYCHKYVGTVSGTGKVMSRPHPCKWISEDEDSSHHCEFQSFYHKATSDYLYKMPAGQRQLAIDFTAGNRPVVFQVWQVPGGGKSDLYEGMQGKTCIVNMFDHDVQDIHVW